MIVCLRQVQSSFHRISDKQSIDSKPLMIYPPEDIPKSHGEQSLKLQ